MVKSGTGIALLAVLCAGVLGCSTPPYKVVSPAEEAALVEQFNGEYRVIPQGENDNVVGLSLRPGYDAGRMAISFDDHTGRSYQLTGCRIGTTTWHAKLGEPEAAIEELVQCRIYGLPSEPQRTFTIARVKPGFSVQHRSRQIVVNSGYYAELQLTIGGPTAMVLERQ